MKSGLYALAGASATATAAAWAKRLDPPMTKLSKRVLRVEPRVAASPPALWSCGGRRLDVVRLLDLDDRALEGVLPDLGVDDDREVRDLLVLVAQAGDRVEEGKSDALLEHAAGEFVRHLEIEGAGHDALGLDQADEAVQLRGDPLVGGQPTEH